MKGIVDIRIVDDEGHHHVLVSQQTNLEEGGNAKVQETLEHLGKIKRGRDIALTVQGFLADGKPAESDQEAARWTVSYLIRTQGGYRGSEKLLTFDNRESADRFARNLHDAFASGRTITLEESGPAAQAVIRQQGASGSVVQLTAAKSTWGAGPS